jgi:hypothetical protein
MARKKKQNKPSGPIEAKPTKYRGTTFRSRLEARWAVYLDNHPLVDSWDYEARTFTHRETGWTYTPDFVVKVGMVLQGWIEVKPEIPTEQTIQEIHSFVELLPGCQGFHLGLAFGSFYQEEPRVFMMGPSACPSPKDVLKHAQKLTKVPILGHQGALDVAARYRFDLPEQVPAMRKPGGKSPWDYWKEQAKKEREGRQD